ncbi:palmitoyltransferase ZDHHC23-B [Erpetoichthys calabaricus]|uniref:Palmitoyltransferase n=1 Tax=Erpetoichthys calabaricus TaxID=27687 RepID=A0A8C4RSD7_ERPCA|nr:palmitoyltransferase ZDHHC23-B [Erpetoichthys calabaricus]
MMKTHKKRDAALLSEEDTLCCCEYVDQHGQKNHVMACCCDCEELDQVCDRWLKCEALPPNSLNRVFETLADRCRVPWISGAQRVDLTVLPPLLLLPVSLHIAALHFLLALIILTTLPICILWYYYVTHRQKGHTLFFLSLVLFSLGYMYYLFVTEVVPRGDVHLMQLAAVTTGLILTLLALAWTKRDPGYLRTIMHANVHSTVRYYQKQSERVGNTAPNGIHHDFQLFSESQTPQNNGNNDKKSWCTACKMSRPPRAGHCRICASCVQRLDHHCVWINNCVGQANHCAFLLTLFFFLMTSVYGIILTLGSICRGQSVLFALFYCPGVYDQYSSALCFTCTWYSTIVTAGMLHLLVIQLINVSYNVTEREARIALRQKTARKYLWGLIIDTGLYNLGFSHNWREFLTMSASAFPSKLRLEDVV